MQDLWLILTEIGRCDQNFSKFQNTKFKENPSDGVSLNHALRLTKRQAWQGLVLAVRFENPTSPHQNNRGVPELFPPKPKPQHYYVSSASPSL
jgi:hypothetical protein